VLFLKIIDVERVTVTRFVGMDGVQDGTGAEQANFINQLIKLDSTLSQREIEDARNNRVLFLPIIDVERVTVTRFVGMDGVQDGTGAEQANFIEELIKLDSTLSQREIKDARHF